ncbi:FAD-binding protein [Prauserella halophila]|uniref:FAD-binding protein n=1 Tax=Prauserella halophila TaxID=185641 RepID=A0ABP4GJX8_9PSEU|nr:FAD-dependent oxidoreductase [Prauserella halophila]MCP2237408.1 3-oxo-5alpha-steroid 4-dehydrogenase [Prauserella halophila]
MSEKTPVSALDVAEIDSFDHETDVLVVGFGCAGAAAALEAHAAGARTTVLERQSGGGGSAAMSGGEIYLGGGTPIQTACGFADTAEEMEKFLLSALGPDADAEKVGLYCRGSLEHYRWLTGLGVPFKPSLWDTPTWVPPTDDGLMWMGEFAHPHCDVAVPAPRGHRVTADGFGGRVLMSVLGDAVAASDVAVHTDTGATRLIVERHNTARHSTDRSSSDRGSADGPRVVGVVARHFGETVTYRARHGVVLTTGGFADNADMVAQHAPQLVGLPANSDGGDDGRGIVMAQAVGAAVRHMSAGQVGIALVPGMMVRGMIVNDQGQRFVNEDTYPGLVGQAALFHHGLKVWVILDQQAYEEVPEDQRWGVVPHFVAETADELEREIGMPDGALRTTIGEYNRHAARGEDPYFHKTARWLRPLNPPLAAIDVRRGITPPEHGDAGGGGAEVFTLGGLHTTGDGAVLDLDGGTVAGLYAAGRATSGLHSWGYISGTSLGDGTFFGRRAGRAAAGR